MASAAGRREEGGNGAARTTHAARWRCTQGTGRHARRTNPRTEARLTAEPRGRHSQEEAPVLLDEAEPLRDAQPLRTPAQLEGVVGVQQRGEEQRDGGAHEGQAAEEADLHEEDDVHEAGVHDARERLQQAVLALPCRTGGRGHPLRHLVMPRGGDDLTHEVRGHRPQQQDGELVSAVALQLDAEAAAAERGHADFVHEQRAAEEDDVEHEAVEDALARVRHAEDVS
eukprot:CAMPEP_0113276690 /NCGR_PEP_ID=MMETSP0008_2-20120614/25627_1 /TAXON_ID=97485 /ORGANISM="Prymnesium parvum" /LENGTH=226 /DNA_ID=CAMNT_0000126507 /DNA_START=342 /DNA_END=1021 /DNA_ORIENTATION=+ /assembly_acc=CAM_ASM_000153